jgi:carboxylesterase
MAYSIGPSLGPFEFEGKSPGVLLIHGFTGNPYEMRSMAEHLNRKLGLYCYAPLLPGHGLPPDALRGVTAQHWLNAAHDALEHTLAHTPEVIVTAFSMGGALSAILLGENHLSGSSAYQRVRAFIALAPMVTTRIPLIPFTALLGQITPWFYPLKFMPIDSFGIRGKILQFDPTLDLDDPLVLARLRQEIRIPVSVAEELRKVARRALSASRNIHMPTLIVQGTNDLVLDPEGARRLYKSIAAADKTLLLLTGSDHDFTLPNRPGNEELRQAVAAWLSQRINLAFT